jgi:glycosyltransferase involved in cell wall biosynthesis
MKIALLSTDDRENLRKYDLKVPIVPTPQEALLQGFVELPEVEIHFISCVQRPVHSPAQLAPNVFYHSLNVPKIGWLRTAYQGCVRAVRKKLREIQPDIVHGQGTERDCAMSAVFSGFPNVLTIHGNMRLVAALNRARPFSYAWLAAQMEGFLLPRTNGVVCITNYTRHAVEKLARRTWVLPNATDKNYFNIQPTPEASPVPIGLCVGTICARKNQNDFIRALDPLAKEQKFKMIFASGPVQDNYGREFHQLVRERPWCEHVGFLNREQLKVRLATASFVALPTREDNCPMVVLEGMAAGVPVIASKVGGVPDLIEPERTGLFCDPDRPETFREGVKRLLTDRLWAQQLAAAAKAEARRRFHPLVVAQKHLEIYREVLGSRQQGMTGFNGN